MGNGTRTSLSYDSASQLTQLVNLAPSGSTLSSFGYRYDPAGLRRSVQESTGARVTWTYDAANQVTSEARVAPVIPMSLPRALASPLGFLSSPGYSITHMYDLAGNRLLKLDGGARTTFAYDAGNQLRYQLDLNGRTSFTFDGVGNLATQASPNAGTTTQLWDGDNRLVQMALPSGGRNTFAYNGDDQRVLREDSTGAATLVWDRQNVLQEVESGSLLAQYTQGAGVYGPLLSQRRSGASQFYLFDGLGSTDRLTDAGGNVTDQYCYEAFGALRFTKGTSANPYQYIGQLGYAFDSDTGLYYLRQRFYRPDLARFSSTGR